MAWKKIAEKTVKIISDQIKGNQLPKTKYQYKYTIV
jgi:hypothetical protein